MRGELSNPEKSDAQQLPHNATGRCDVPRHLVLAGFARRRSRRSPQRQGNLQQLFKFVWLYPLSHFTGLVATFPRLAYNDIYAEAYLYAFRTFTPLPPRYSNRHGHVYADRYVFGDVACYAVLFCRSLANAEAPSEAH